MDNRNGSPPACKSQEMADGKLKSDLLWPNQQSNIKNQTKA